MPPALGTRAETGRGIFVGTVALSGLERRNRAQTVDLSHSTVFSTTAAAAWAPHSEGIS